MADVRILDEGVRDVMAALNAANGDFMEGVADDARGRAPVKTGEFRDSIHVVRDGDTVDVVSDSDHAAFVEFGTSDTPAQPTITPAFAAGLTHLTDVVGARMARDLR